ncbi:glycosyltransferase family 2 protein [Pontiella agarivorans]|uniref:Glycosyltransferase family 2 protein n=1 Tax=Pontiella agarivorans TaxID=3038953 RepID=A0ABU5N1T4_9BACT|nr:glycosyltransferase family 2 protein [Pontiella agarivorans]MDZ8120411.1 glycosyltransferase family 2 protein [Pontiella agarivorans]
MNKLSVAIITYNEEAVIADAVKSAAFADEVVVLDSGSKDRTCAVAQELGAKVFSQEWLGFGRQKQRAVELCSNDWVFVLDSDERIMPELAEEIQVLLKSAPDRPGYQVARLNWFFGKPIRYCGLYPDYTVRLFNRTSGRFTEDAVHEKVVLDGEPGTLKNHMEHLAYDSIEQFVDKQNRYSSLNVKPSGLLTATLRSMWTFVRLFVFKKGILGGSHGFLIAVLYSQYTFWKYVKGREMETSLK